MVNQELETNSITENVKEKIHGCDLKTCYKLFGVECDEGWYPLVKKAIAAVARYNGINKYDPDFGPVEFSQIKEKYGWLCLYLNYYPSDELWKEMRAIEEESQYICEHCGSTKNVRTRGIHGWTFTYCDKCAAAEEKRFKELYGKHISGKKEAKKGENKGTT